MTPKLERSFAHCRRVARARARNFYLSFLLLPPDQRDAMCAIYAFMRRSDDIADDETVPVASRRARDRRVARGSAGGAAGRPVRRAGPARVPRDDRQVLDSPRVLLRPAGRHGKRPDRSRLSHVRRSLPVLLPSRVRRRHHDHPRAGLRPGSRDHPRGEVRRRLPAHQHHARRLRRRRHGPSVLPVRGTGGVRPDPRRLPAAQAPLHRPPLPELHGVPVATCRPLLPGSPPTCSSC